MSPRLASAVREIVEVSARAGHLGRLDAVGAEKLRARVLDHFAKGDYLGGLSAMLGNAKTPRARMAVRDIADSALMSLGVDVDRTRAQMKTSLLALAKGGATLPYLPEVGPRASPIRNVFRGLGFPLDQAARTLVKVHALEQARVETSLAKARSAPDRLEALRALEAKLDPERLTDASLSGLMAAYREDEQWADMIRVFERSPHEFRRLHSARREYALALHQSGRAEDARRTLDGLLRAGDRSNVNLGMLGRMLKDGADRAAGQGDTVRANKLLGDAIIAYRDGHRADLDALYPAVALPAVLEQRGQPADRAEARAVAEVVLYNAERRNRFGEKQYWDVATALEMSLFLGDGARAEKWLAEVLAAPSEPWMRQSTARSLERLAKLRGADADPRLIASAKALRAVPGTVRARDVQVTPPAQQDAADVRERLLAAVIEGSYRFGGRSPKWLSGNYAYSGIAHDVRVTPSDVTYFDRVMRAAKIDAIGEPLAASAAMDALVREHFGTAALEDLESPAHQLYDRVMPGLARLMSATSDNSQTNVSADWINGLADCRQHAPAKLMLWEAWKRDQTNRLLAGILDATRAGNGAKATELRQRLDALTPWEMRILDAQILERASGALREEHTLTLLVRRGAPHDGGPLAVAEEIRLADAFYHHTYPLADGVLTAHLEGGALRLDVPGLSAEGEAVSLVPAPYSRDRAVESLDFGQLSFRGRTVATPGWELDVPVEGLDLSQLHQQVDAEMRALIEQAKAQVAPARTG